ncbi:unnamed protein product [Enterobius vermicularis]|uniref:Protein CNPPD1 n=1 Tax=Enterobius vermicularis TaxID=51028 RepID=A0A0N4VM95_ENTVE|nr:unnamed protein product [Enterobius vermicularis]
MAPKSGAFRHLQRRMRRTLNYGTRRMQNLPFSLSGNSQVAFFYCLLPFYYGARKYGCVDACTFLVAMVYVDRVRIADKAYFECSDPNDIYLPALVIASKFLHDGGLEEFVYNDEWAASASTSLNRVNELELKILDILSWDVSVSGKDFERVLYEAEAWVARNALLKQGFLTYNEAAILSSRISLFHNILLPFISIFASLLVLYSAVMFSVLVLPKVALTYRIYVNGNLSCFLTLYSQRVFELSSLYRRLFEVRFLTMRVLGGVGIIFSAGKCCHVDF